MQNPLAKNYIFYSIIDTDLNEDGQLDNQDPTYFFASNREGKNLRRISPKNQSLISWQIPQHNQWLFITTKEDANKNKIFDADDKNNIYQIDLSQKELKLELVLSKDFQKQVESTYQKLDPQEED